MSKNNLKPLGSVMDELKTDGYATDFRLSNNKLVPLQYPTKSYQADEFEITDIYRFEGDTDPADASILYAIKTHDGLMGTISNGYGAKADTNLDSFLNQQLTK